MLTTTLKFLCALAGAALVMGAQAQPAFPTKPITLLVPYGAGGSTDVSTRAIATAMSQRLGQPVIIENRPGGSGAVAIAAMKQRPADGHTLLILGSTLISNQFMNEVGYDAQKDFTTLAIHMTYNAGLVVRADSPWKTFPEFLAYAKANPGKVSYSSSAGGSPQHLAMARIAQQQGLEMIFVPFGDGVKAVTAVLGNQVTASSQVTEWKPHVEAGTLRLLVTYGAKRMPQFPDVPTLQQSGFDIVGVGFNAVVAPKGTPTAATKALEAALKSVLTEQGSEFSEVIKKYDLTQETMIGADAQAYVDKFTLETQRLIKTIPMDKR